MQNIGLNDIREKYLSFFESKGHLRLESFPLIPKNDASLLLINSGMAPLKPYFTGAEVPPRKRVTTCQKCIRTPDIERVGKTARHGTFFEMLGNFSFGDYFKKEAIAWAWEFLTKVMEIPEDVLWVTVYEEDDEAKDIWVNEIGVRPERVVKMGKEDNFWEHGTGPCGPCSEIHIDRGPGKGCGRPDCKIGCDCDRYMEVWNLVFTQFDRDESGAYNPLPNPNIDTGMGLERLAAVMQGVDNLFEVDTVRNVMAHISKVAGVSYKAAEKTDVSLRVITDHIRSTVMMVSDGVIPSNEGRGYVLRRLLRRAARHGKLLNIKRQFLHEIADTVIDESKGAYPELDEKRDYIKRIIKKEEERFDKTVDNGLEVLSGYMQDAKRDNRLVLSGEEAFKLHDTYGFPLDLTVEIAQENGMTVDVDGFDRAMREQRDTARRARKEGSSWEGGSGFGFDIDEPTQFVGYFDLEADAKILGIWSDDAEEIVDAIGKGQKGVIVTDKTPFYAEMGGQVGDSGRMESDSSAKAAVVYTKKTDSGIYLHEIVVEDGEFCLNDAVKLAVDRDNRMSIQRNHSATHLLHRALKDVLGPHVAQAGSFVSADRLRFDFSHFEAMTPHQIRETEDKVNDAILAALPIEINEYPIEEAKKLGATAQFGEKYGEIVRVVKMGDYSIEFCGGCHLSNTSQAGLFKILSESGVAAGTRRIEALTGYGVLSYISERDELICRTAEILKANHNEIDKKAENTIQEMKQARKELESLKAKLANSRADDILSGRKTISDVDVVCARIDGMPAGDLRTMGDSIKEKLGCGVVVLASNAYDKITFIAMATKQAVEKGAHCGNIIREITRAAEGSGGGKPDMAQGGGKNADKIDSALALVDGLIKDQIK
ncbi:MAG: alanine--tRNA ligase [Clostridia bacterium]|nr:alanine--tRNA ligase [Clostridia bacterium]